MHVLTGQWVPKPILTTGRGRAAPVVAYVRRSDSRFNRLEYRRTCRWPKTPHPRAKRDPHTPVRFACMSMSTMPSLGRAPRGQVAAGSLRPIEGTARMECAPERVNEAAAEPGGDGTLVTDRGGRPDSDTAPSDLRAATPEDLLVFTESRRGRKKEM